MGGRAQLIFGKQQSQNSWKTWFGYVSEFSVSWLFLRNHNFTLFKFQPKQEHLLKSQDGSWSLKYDMNNTSIVFNIHSWESSLIWYEIDMKLIYTLAWMGLRRPVTSVNPGFQTFPANELLGGDFWAFQLAGCERYSLQDQQDGWMPQTGRAPYIREWNWNTLAEMTCYSSNLPRLHLQTLTLELSRIINLGRYRQEGTLGMFGREGRLGEMFRGRVYSGLFFFAGGWRAMFTLELSALMSADRYKRCAWVGFGSRYQY